MTILIPDQYILIYKASWLSLASTLYALHMKHYTLWFVPGSIFLTSINYWRKPDYSWRRYLDIIVTKSMAVYQLSMAYTSEYAVPYYLVAVLALSFYPIGIYYYKKNDHWKSTYSHIMLHLVCNVCNVILYSGAPLPLPPFLTRVDLTQTEHTPSDQSLHNSEVVRCDY